MKKVVLTAAAAFAAMSMTASALEMGELREAYSPDAFSNADANWKRITANRINACSRYGEKRKSRVEVLVDRYLAIGKALDANDAGGAVAATERLASAVNLNDRFEECWRQISRRNGVSREFRAMLSDMPA